MGLWDDIFQTYKDAEFHKRSASLPSKPNSNRQTIYIFAYLDGGNGAANSHLSLEEHVTHLEMKVQAHEMRLKALEDKYDSLVQYLGIDKITQAKLELRKKQQDHEDQNPSSQS